MPGRRLIPGDLRTQQQRASNADRQQVPVGWGPQPVGASQPQGGSNPKTRVAFPPENFAPKGSVPVDTIQEADITSGAAAATVICTIRVPDVYSFVVEGIGFGAESSVALRYLSWTLMANPPQAPIYGYINMPASIGSIEEPSRIDSLVLGSSVVFTIEARNNWTGLATTYHYFVRVRGWFYWEREPRS